jgi:vacuolar-type H+-ATPase subunit I/STV1
LTIFKGCKTFEEVSEERHEEMTGEEMERGIEFLLKSQANFEAQLAKTSEQIETLAKTHAEFTQFVRSNLEAQSELNQSLRETVRALTIAQTRTDDRLGDLEGRNGQP